MAWVLKDDKRESYFIHSGYGGGGTDSVKYATKFESEIAAYSYIKLYDLKGYTLIEEPK